MRARARFISCHDLRRRFLRFAETFEELAREADELVRSAPECHAERIAPETGALLPMCFPITFSGKQVIGKF